MAFMDNRMKTTLENIFFARREEAKADQRKRFDEAMQNSVFSSLERERRKLVVLLARAKAENLDCLKLANRLEEVKTKQTQLLSKLNISLNCNYKCAKCSDSGYLSNGEKCSCYLNEHFRLLCQEANIASFGGFTFADNKTEPNTHIGNAYEKMQSYCENFPSSKIQSIVFSGGSGVGKTCLISAMANDLLKKGFSVVYMLSYEMNNLFLKFHTDFSSAKISRLEALTECDMLIIDDLGTEPLLNNVTIPYLFNVINTRLHNGKNIIFSTNLSRNAILDRYGERITSRLLDKTRSRFFLIQGDDLRFIQKK